MADLTPKTGPPPGTTRFPGASLRLSPRPRCSRSPDSSLHLSRRPGPSHLLPTQQAPAEPEGRATVTRLPVWRRNKGRLAAVAAIAAAIITAAIVVPLSLGGSRITSAQPTFVIPLHATAAGKAIGYGAATGQATARQDASGSWNVTLTVHHLKPSDPEPWYGCWYLSRDRRKVTPAGSFIVPRSGSDTFPMTSAADPRDFPTMEITFQRPNNTALGRAQSFSAARRCNSLTANAAWLGCRHARHSVDSCRSARLIAATCWPALLPGHFLCLSRTLISSVVRRSPGKASATLARPRPGASDRLRLAHGAACARPSVRAPRTLAAGRATDHRLPKKGPGRETRIMGYDMHWQEPPADDLSDDGYFRLNIWGMPTCREVMASTGMGEWVELPPEPQCKDFGLTLSEAGFVGTDEAMAAYYQAWDELGEVVRRDFGAIGIPLHKLSSNDGWLVTPAEIAAALEQAPEQASDEDGEALAWWPEWIEFLPWSSAPRRLRGLVTTPARRSGSPAYGAHCGRSACRLSPSAAHRRSILRNVGFLCTDHIPAQLCSRVTGQSEALGDCSH